MKVADLNVGSLYRLSNDKRVGFVMGATPVEEASRLALYVLRRNAQVAPVDPKMASTWSAEALIYLGAKHMVTGYDHILFLLGVIFFLYRMQHFSVH